MLMGRPQDMREGAAHPSALLHACCTAAVRAFAAATSAVSTISLHFVCALTRALASSPHQQRHPLRWVT